MINSVLLDGESGAEHRNFRVTGTGRIGETACCNLRRRLMVAFRNNESGFRSCRGSKLFPSSRWYSLSYHFVDRSFRKDDF